MVISVTTTRDYHTAQVILFKDSGKYYTEEWWDIPDDAIGPHDMERSPQCLLRHRSLGVFPF